MKTIEQLITSFETKAATDEYSIVSREDLITAAGYLKNIVKDLDSIKISLNADRVNIPESD
jgi:hypothetical protein